MVGFLKLLHLVSSLSNSLSKAPVVYGVLPIIVMWHRVDKSTPTPLIFSKEKNNNKKTLFTHTN